MSVLILTCGLQFQVLTAIDVFCVSGWRGWCMGIDERESLMYFDYDLYVVYYVLELLLMDLCINFSDLYLL